MKRNILLIILLVFPVSLLFAQIPTDGLQFYYPLNGNIYDASGNDEDGLVSAYTFTQDRFFLEDHVEKTDKLTPSRRFKLTTLGRSKLTTPAGLN